MVGSIGTVTSVPRRVAASVREEGAWMTPKRTLVVAVAVVVGVAASVLSYVFLNNAQQRAYHNAKLVQAYVVAKPVPQTLNGTDAVNDGYIVNKKIPAEFRPAGAVTKLSAIEGKVAVAPFSVGQVLVTSMFASASSASSNFSQLIPPNDVAISISVDPVHGVAGFPVPGNKVDLFVNVNGAESVLLQNVSILASGTAVPTAITNQSSSSTTTTTTPASSSGLYTFSVSPADSQRIALAEQEGLGLYMVLVPPNNAPVNLPPLTQGNITNAS
jgi:pilus assembly protein CpaB